MQVVRQMLLGLAVVGLPGAGALAAQASVADTPRPELRPNSGEPIAIAWKTLASLDLESGVAPPTLQVLDGKRVIIAAYIVPLGFAIEAAKEFLLVPKISSSVQPPPLAPNQMIHVRMKGSRTVKLAWWDPVHFVGVLHLRKVESPYGVACFEMEGLESRP